MPMYYHNEMLFSEIYLEEITRQTENADVLASLKVLGEYREYADTHNLQSWKESYVHEVLSALGFFAQSSPTPSSGGGFERDPITYLFPMGSAGTEKPLSLCYVLLPEENLDNTTIGRNWAEKIIRALRQHNLQWGLLTNGKQWRIYHQEEPTPYETYLEVDLEAILADKAKEAYQIFYKFMKAENFVVHEDGKCQFDRFKKESQDKIDYIEKELANALKQREEGGKGVLSDLCMGYVEELRRRKEGDLDDEGLRKKIYHGAMLYMFRLLFLFYADARRLLSDENHDLLTKVESECRTRHDGNASSDLNFPIWDSLEHIFVDIDQTYNGGLFSPQESEFTRFLSDTRIGDAYLVNVIFNLTTYREKNGQEKPISYRDMSVRHLGTLYEGLLEHKLFIAREDTEVKVTKGKIQFIPASQGGKLMVGHTIKSGEVYFAGDPSERKSTGSYYTPEYIVDYIVRNTVGEKLKELKDAFLKEEHTNLEAYANSIDDDERNALITLLEENALTFVREKVLDLSVLDPAMGSGHFLVNAANLIANFITEILNEIPIQGNLESGAGYWRRWVVENCIYGVDLNPLAVELAKLSIWILSMAKDQPLSFLNHHLKCGNSLVGAKLEEIGNHPFSTVKKEPRQLHFFERDPDFKAAVEAVILKSRQIAGKASANLEDVRDKKAWLEEIDQILEGYKAICDVHTSLYFNNTVDEDEYKMIVEKRDFNLAKAYEISNQYFHWELEFPYLFISNRNVDCIIGNPPYDVISADLYLNSIYSDVFYGRPNLWQAFIAKGIELLSFSGSLSMIFPKTLLTDTYSKNLREFLKKNCTINSIIDIRDRHDTFPGVLQACIISTISKLVNQNIDTTLGSVENPSGLDGNILAARVPYKKIFLVSKSNSKILHSPFRDFFDIWDIIFSRSKPLSSYGVYAKTGPIQWDKFSQFLYPTEIDGSTMLIWAENVQRYRLAKARTRADKQYISLLKTPPPNIIGQAILTQRITAQEQEWRIIACLIDGKSMYYSENHTNYIQIPSEFDGVSLLCLLNSTLLDFVFRHLNSNTQVSASELNALPIILPNKKESTLLNKIYGEIITFAQNSKEAKTLQARIDEIIFDIYGLTNAQKEFVLNYRNYCKLTSE